MAENLRIPPPRNLDIYRLVVARGLKQAAIAVLFSVCPVRICQIVRRVRLWIDGSIGDWLFPRAGDLRFYAALEAAQIPENALITGPGWTYRRQITFATEATASQDVNQPASLSAAPLNSLPSASKDTIGATPSAANDFAPSHSHDLAHRLAELLIVSQKSRRLTGPFKAPSFAAG